MRRRELLVVLGIALPSVTARGQAQRVHRVAVLFPAGAEPGLRELVEALAKLGYDEGRNIAYEVRAAEIDAERLPQLARELVGLRPDVIVSATERAGSALRAATRDIPIVLALVGDPVALGFTQSIGRPTGNVTGFTTGHDTVVPKRLELLREMVPGVHKVALMWNPDNAQHRLVLDRTREAAATLGMELVSLPVSRDEEISPAIAQADRERAGGLVVAADPLTVRNRRSIIDECTLRDLPAVHTYSFEVRDGALASYGSDVGEDYGRTALYVDRLLKGAKIAELPFQEPTQMTLTINLRTAKALGLAISPALLARADEVIE